MLFLSIETGSRIRSLTLRVAEFVARGNSRREKERKEEKERKGKGEQQEDADDNDRVFVDALARAFVKFVVIVIARVLARS